MPRAWELYRRLIAIHIRAQMQYRVSFLADILITAILGWSAVEMGLSYLLVWVACVFASIRSSAFTLNFA